MRVLIKPLVTEKSAGLKTEGKYFFKVNSAANKIEIKNEIEKVFGVKVERVNTLNVLGKAKRLGKSFGYTNDWKKAIVFLKKGEQIKEYEDLF